MHSVLPQFRRRLPAFNVASITAALVLLFLIIYPLYRVLTRIFVSSDGTGSFGGLASVAQQPDLGGLILTTIEVVGASGVLALVIGTFMAWLNERTNARWGVITDSMPVVPFLLPPVAGSIGWLLLASPRSGYLNGIVVGAAHAVGINVDQNGPFDVVSLYGVIFIYTLYMIPYVFLTTSAGLRNMNFDLEEQSRICGSGPVRTILKVTVPAIKPSIASSILLVVWFGSSLYSVPVILGTQSGVDVLSVRIVNLIKFEYPPRTDAAIGLGLIVLGVVAACWLSLRVVLRHGRFSTVGGKGRRATRIELGWWKWPARGLFVGYLLCAAVLPFLALLLVSLTGFWSSHIDLHAMHLNSIKEALLDNADTTAALLHSLILGVIGATIAISLAAIVSVYVHKSKSRFSSWIDAGIKLPGTMTHVVIALGFILAFAGSPFYLYGTMTILLLAYIVVYFPQGSIAADAAASQVGSELAEASHVCGAATGRTFRKVNLPIMFPALIAGWALMFARMAGDLDISAVLSGQSNVVTGFRILEVNTAGDIAGLGAIALALTVISSVVTLSALTVPRLARRRTRALKQPLPSDPMTPEQE